MSDLRSYIASDVRQNVQDIIQSYKQKQQVPTSPYQLVKPFPIRQLNTGQVNLGTVETVSGTLPNGQEVKVIKQGGMFKLAPIPAVRVSGDTYVSNIEEAIHMTTAGRKGFKLLGNMDTFGSSIWDMRSGDIYAISQAALDSLPAIQEMSDEEAKSIYISSFPYYNTPMEYVVQIQTSMVRNGVWDPISCSERVTGGSFLQSDGKILLYKIYTKFFDSYTIYVKGTDPEDVIWFPSGTVSTDAPIISHIAWLVGTVELSNTLRVPNEQNIKSFDIEVEDSGIFTYTVEDAKADTGANDQGFVSWEFSDLQLGSDSKIRACITLTGLNSIDEGWWWQEYTRQFSSWNSLAGAPACFPEARDGYLILGTRQGLRKFGESIGPIDAGADGEKFTNVTRKVVKYYEDLGSEAGAIVPIIIKTHHASGPVNTTGLDEKYYKPPSSFPVPPSTPGAIKHQCFYSKPGTEATTQTTVTLNLFSGEDPAGSFNYPGWIQWLDGVIFKIVDPDTNRVGASTPFAVFDPHVPECKRLRSADGVFNDPNWDSLKTEYLTIAVGSLYNPYILMSNDNLIANLSQVSSLPDEKALKMNNIPNSSGLFYYFSSIPYLMWYDSKLNKFYEIDYTFTYDNSIPTHPDFSNPDITLSETATATFNIKEMTENKQNQVTNEPNTGQFDFTVGSVISIPVTLTGGKKFVTVNVEGESGYPRTDPSSIQDWGMYIPKSDGSGERYLWRPSLIVNNDGLVRSKGVSLKT